MKLNLRTSLNNISILNLGYIRIIFNQIQSHRIKRFKIEIRFELPLKVVAKS